MSLQGTLATFSIPDVMRLLASTKKTGCLAVDGDQGQGEVYLDAGQVVAASSIGAVTSDEEVTVVLALLRYEDGSFVFEDGSTSPAASDPIEIESLLEQAGELAEEWAELEAVVPSGDAWLTLVAELPEDEVEIDRDDWRLIVAIGTGVTATQLAAVLETDVMGVARSLKDLVTDDKLVDVAAEAPEGALVPAATDAPLGASDDVIDLVGEEPAGETWSSTAAIDDASDEAPTWESSGDEGDGAAGGEAPSWDALDDAPGSDEASSWDALGDAPGSDEAPSWDALGDAPGNDEAPSWAPLGGPVDEVVEDEPDDFEDAAPVDDGGFDPNALLREIGMAPGGDDDGFLPAADGGLGGLGGAPIKHIDTDIDPEDAAEMARQLANLAPEAAKAVAAAATASTDAELQAALDEVVALDSSINRDLLMKFLGSVNS